MSTTINIFRIPTVFISKIVLKESANGIYNEGFIKYTVLISALCVRSIVFINNNPGWMPL